MDYRVKNLNHMLEPLENDVLDKAPYGGQSYNNYIEFQKIMKGMKKRWIKEHNLNQKVRGEV